MTNTWSNWSGSVTCQPRQIALPDSEAAVAALVKQAADARQVVRVTGSGHSFLPLCATDDVLVSLDQLAGIESVDRERLEATVFAGTKLHALGEPLAAHGMALANQGDIDRQSLAGAISTGTHGTGRSLGSLSTQVVGLRIVTADSQLLDVSFDRDSDAMAAVRVSLGALGVTTAIRLRLVPAYRLHEKLWQEPIEECLDRLDERIAATRHFEFFWYQATDLVHAKALDPTDQPPDELPDMPGERIDHSYVVFPTVARKPLQRNGVLGSGGAGASVFSRDSGVDAHASRASDLASGVPHAGGRRDRLEHVPGAPDGDAVDSSG